jgi:site-specific recombinase XerD
VHGLRHAFATHLLDHGRRSTAGLIRIRWAFFCATGQNGTELRIIQVLPGHSNIGTTTRYTAVSPQVVAANVSPLDRLDRPAAKPAPAKTTPKKR